MKAMNSLRICHKDQILGAEEEPKLLQVCHNKQEFHQVEIRDQD